MAGGWHFRIGSMAAIAGAADTAAFVLTRWSRMRANPGRLAGSLLLLGLWLGLAAQTGRRGDAAPAAAVGLSATLLAANLALLGVHLRAHAAGPRVYLGPAVAGAVLADSLRRR
ncbi:MAG: hypothetical protein E6J45_04095 [Chloroflexi bacterium]|nr:MAG: hypothetical protein E6J45_04095 [Chloroflexota bacterium]